MNNIEILLKTAIRTLIREPEFEPNIAIVNEGSWVEIIGDMEPFDMSVVIGRHGSLKFAMQSLIAHYLGKHHEDIDLLFQSSGATLIPRNNRRNDPKVEEMQGLYEAMLAMVPEATGEPLEPSRTMLHGRIQMPEYLIKEVGYHMHRLFGAAAASNGFPATLYIERTQ